MGVSDNGCDWPYVLKPRWIHDMLLLWRRKEPYEMYLDQVVDYTVREVRDKALRRRCVLWIANHFAPSRTAATLNQNVWASYSHHFRTNDLAVAYLAHLTCCEPLARQTTAAVHGQISPGKPLGRGLMADVNAVSGALESLLRTLQQWEVLAADPRQGGYLVEKQLDVAPQVFPLLVWVWWLDTRQASVTAEEFAQSPLWSWVKTSDFAAGWQRYAGRLWTQENDGGAVTFFMHPTDTAGFSRSLLNLLSTDGRSGRQLPRHGERADLHVETVQARESILGR